LTGKDELAKMVSGLSLRKKIPVVIGGDHSLTTTAVRAISQATGSRLAILYFDAHPDFVYSARNYYGSVLTDSSESLDYKSSMLIGTRAAEPEELQNADREGVQIMNPLDIAELGLQKAADIIQQKTRNSRVYVSIDLDCLDPSFAPGVSVPSPGGLSSTELVFLLVKAIAGRRVMGLDIVELCPDFDINGMTASVAARVLSESIASLKSM
jgi:agmatinase